MFLGSLERLGFGSGRSIAAKRRKGQGSAGRLRATLCPLRSQSREGFTVAGGHQANRISIHQDLAELRDRGEQPVKYRDGNPEWSGCGTMPAWAKLKGNTLESYRVTWRSPESGATRSCGFRSSSRRHRPCWQAL